MSRFDEAQAELRARPLRWLVTGAAGFIGSNLVESLLRLGQSVVGLDNFSLGKHRNLDELLSQVSPEQAKGFRFVEADIREPESCHRACAGVDYVLHQAALGSVPRSIEDPLTYHASNVTGHLNLLLAARDAGVRRFVYASSSAVYGDHPALPKREADIGNSISPYAANKRIGELYAEVMARTYGLESVGLRYFNVFGPRQDPEGAYAAVIPKWISSLLQGEPIYINGTGETSRDFCYVRNVVQANILAAVVRAAGAANQVYNIAVNRRTTLNELYALLRERLAADEPRIARIEPIYREFRAGDVLHSQADIAKAEELLGYRPTHTIEQGLDEALPWYKRNAGTAAKVQ